LFFIVCPAPKVKSQGAYARGSGLAVRRVSGRPLYEEMP
jgi:hypothetical protein